MSLSSQTTSLPTTEQVILFGFILPDGEKITFYEDEVIE
tara:strand:+ start:107 stop:223 length:117 start_codon:yes stop_codon:yes gene_type:complete